MVLTQRVQFDGKRLFVILYSFVKSTFTDVGNVRNNIIQGINYIRMNFTKTLQTNCESSMVVSLTWVVFLVLHHEHLTHCTEERGY